MYIVNKGTVNKIVNKRNCFWLVESVRIGCKTKQRNLLYLGNVDITENEKTNLGKLIERKFSKSNKNLAKKKHAGCYVIRMDKKDLSAKEIWDFI